MKLSEQWLKEWVNPKISREELIHKLTMAGVSVESCVPFEDDFIYEFELTPNRADCLSVMGIAREVSVITDTPLNHLKQPSHQSTISNPISIHINTPKECPRYIGRTVKNLINPKLDSAEFKKIQQ